MMRATLIALVLVWVVANAPTPAFAVQKVHGALDLSSDKKVAELMPAFLDAARSNVVFSHCLHAYDLSEEQVEYQKVAAKRISDEYLHTFYDAYIRRVGTPPSKSVTDNYTKYAYAQQGKVMQEMADIIAKKGCGNGKVIKTIKFMDKQHRAEVMQQQKEQQEPTPTVLTTPGRHAPAKSTIQRSK
mgnify:CR=1 FL=1